jgi:hypothetical protein
VTEQTVTEDRIRNEHMKEVNVGAHWAYLIGVIAVAFVLMVGLIALLGTTGG